MVIKLAKKAAWRGCSGVWPWACEVRRGPWPCCEHGPAQFPTITQIAPAGAVQARACGGAAGELSDVPPGHCLADMRDAWHGQSKWECVLYCRFRRCAFQGGIQPPELQCIYMRIPVPITAMQPGRANGVVLGNYLLIAKADFHVAYYSTPIGAR